MMEQSQDKNDGVINSEMIEKQCKLRKCFKKLKNSFFIKKNLNHGQFSSKVT